ncbi:hypothetical protein [Streptomyces sp. NPDC085665]|uniref:hypothetical protein n=1 Tax=Streptomyces sp. NPDC085665 TaxID=3365735 RepID=UPI0037CE75BA
MALDRSTALSVAVEAQKAAADGETIDDCPYNADGGPEDRFKARYWQLGFQAAAEGSAGR